ncbi:hypothetical protein MKX01_033597 [Papaver californicum]|nr:hypothetical protein MKX01_033597 [Papaver californicum]
MLVRGEKEGDDLCRKLLQCDNVNTHSEIILRKYLKDWVFESYRTYKPFDIHGLAVMHLCACLGYTWAITLYRLIGFGVDYRGLNRWTALHGRQGATTLLFFHGANPSLVTKPNAEHPCESTTADIASECGHNDLAAYLTDIMENLEKIVRLSTLRAKLGIYKYIGIDMFYV